MPKRRIGLGNQRPTSITNKMDDKNSYATFGFLNESFTLNEIKEQEKCPLPTAAFKKDTNMFSSEFREGFGICSLIMAIQ